MAGDQSQRAAVCRVFVLLLVALLLTAPLSIGQAAGRADATPQLPFTDITSSAGISFTPITGATGEKLLPESMGGGVAFLDHDGDGDQDLLFVGGRVWPQDEPAGSQPSSLALYANDGSGRFTDETVAAGLDTVLYGMGVAVGDIEGDGDDDLFITALGSNRLYRNDGGFFVNVTEQAGVAGSADDWSTAAGFADLDGDGDLDLLVANYLTWSREIDLANDRKLIGVPGRSFNAPTYFDGQAPLLFMNRGDGVFDEVGEAAGLHVFDKTSGELVNKTLAWLFIDMDADGDTDVFAANDTTRNLLFMNDGNGGFEERGRELGVAYDGFGSPTGAMGVDAGFFSGGEELGLFVGNFSDEASSAYVGVPGDGFLFENSVALGLATLTRPALTFGLLLLDVDLDGRLDLLQINGHLEPTIDDAPGGQTWRQAPQLFWNAGTQSRPPFRLAPGRQIGDLATPIVGRGAAAADIDADGDLDLVLTRAGGRPILLRNDQESGHHYLRCVLRGRPGSPTAIGAVVELDVGGTTMRRRVDPNRSYLSQVERVATFGLGEHDEVDGLRVRWPDGNLQTFDVPGVDRTLKLVQTVGEREVLATFLRGKAELESGRLSEALQTLSTAAELAPGSAPTRRNLARALLAAGDAEAALRTLSTAFALDQSSVATVYLQAVSLSRLGRHDEALPLFEQVVARDPNTATLRFQLANCAEILDEPDLAEAQFAETVRLDPAHGAAWFRIAAAARRAQDMDGFRAGNREFLRLRGMYGDTYKTPLSLEACIYTTAEAAGAAADVSGREPPSPSIAVEFSDVTSEVFGNDSAASLLAPLALDSEGLVELLRVRPDGSMERLVIPDAGPARRRTLALNLPGVASSTDIIVGNYYDATPATLQPGVVPPRMPDVFIAGPERSWLLSQDSEGEFSDVTERVGLDNPVAQAAIWVDHEHDGDLDLALAGANGLQLFINTSDGAFIESDELPAVDAPGVDLVAADFDGNGAIDLAVATGTGPTARIDNRRAGRYELRADPPGPWPSADVILTEDLDNDGLPDGVLIGPAGLQLMFEGVSLPAQALDGLAPTTAVLIDYDSDSWLDLLVAGADDSGDGRLVLLRNGGRKPWTDVSDETGLSKVTLAPSAAAIAADVDGDGDSDLILRGIDDTLTVLRNQGGEAGGLLKLRLISLVGSSGAIGTRIELRDGPFFVSRTIQTEQPIEIGLGGRRALDSVLAVWPNGVIDARTSVPVGYEPLSIVVIEQADTGSCPYLYFWDGEKQRFITDMIGGGATGLPLSRDMTNPVYPHEIVVVGDADVFAPQGAAWDVRITSELREAAYYDEVALMIVDHPVGTEVASTGRLRGPPFPDNEVIALGSRRPLLASMGDDGVDRTAAMTEIDGIHAEPGPVLPAPFRGVCLPMTMELDFGPLPVDRPLVLALTGWLEYGTASSQIALSQTRNVEVIFPYLEARGGDGAWHAVDVVVGLPAGKFKTIVCELDGLLPPGADALRLTTTFQPVWDRAALFERVPLAEGALVELSPNAAELDWRGFSDLRVRARTQPKLPDYDVVSQQPTWRGALQGWCTRYGDVLELLQEHDGLMVVLNSGDEMRLTIPAEGLPARPPGTRRTLLWRSVGYNKEADNNNAGGGNVWPLGVDTTFGRSDEEEDAWRIRYNTRWVSEDRFHPRPVGTR